MSDTIDLKDIFENPDNFTDDAKVGDDKEYIGLFFSGHWCAPCRGFTPTLIEYYEEHKTESNYEIVFISSDRNEEEFKNYSDTMPWKALKFDKRDIKNSLAEKFEIGHLPTLVVVDRDGETKNPNARGQVGNGEKWC